MSNIVWLASYPKSGNTWFRVFLTNLLRHESEPASINDLATEPIADGRSAFDQAVGYNSGDLTFEEIDRLRPEVYRHYAQTALRPIFCKVHDAYTFLPDGRPLFPPAATKCVLYFIRNPLDVCVSYAYHSGRQDFDWMIAQMNKSSGIANDSSQRLPQQLRQQLLNWSDHVRSWSQTLGLRVHVTRYEDMMLRPMETFTAAARFAGLPDAPERVEQALRFSRFDEMQRQEKAAGFAERSPTADSFFRKAAIGAWREALTTEQVDILVKHHGEIMRRFDYLTDDGKPVF